MDLCESEHALEKQSTAEKKRLPLVPAENKNGVIRQVRTTEVISRYRSPTPSSPTGSKRFPSPFASRTSSTSIVSSAPQRDTSTERKRPARPSSPPPPSTPIQDTAAEMLLASRKIAGNKLPESLWPSTMRSLSVSFQSDTISVPVGKKEKPISHMPSDRTLRPSSNVAHRQAEISVSRKPTPERQQGPLKGKNSADQSENSKPERKQSPLRGKNSADQSENSKPERKQSPLRGKNYADQSENSKPERKQSPFRGKNCADQSENSKHVDSMHPRLVDQRRWPSRTTGKVSTVLDRSIDLADKTSKTSSLSLPGTSTPSLRRLSLDGTTKHSIKPTSDFLTPISRDGSGIALLNGCSVDDSKTSNTSSLSHSRTGTPSLRRLSLDGTTIPLIKPTNDFPTVICRDESGKAASSACPVDDKTSETSSLSRPGTDAHSLKRLSLDGTTKPLIKPTNDFLMLVSRDESGKAESTGCLSSVSRGCPADDRTRKTSSLPDSGTSTPSLRRLSLDRPIKPLIKSTSDLLMLVSGDESGKAVSNGCSVDDNTINTSCLPHSATGTHSLRRLSLDGTTKPFIEPTSDLLMLKPLDESGKAVSSGCSFNDKTSKTLSLLHLGTSTPSLRRLSLDGTIKPTSDLIMLKSRDGSGKAVSVGCSVDYKPSKSSFLPHSETCTPSLRKLSQDGTTGPSIKSTSDLLMLKPLDESGKAVSSGCSVNYNISKTSSLPQSGTSTPSLRRLSLDGTTKPFVKPTSDLIMLKSHDENGKAMSSGCSVDDKTIKTSSLPHSETCTPSLSRLSQDGTAEPSIKSINDLLMQKPLDESGKVASGGCSVNDKTSKKSLPHSGTSTPSLSRLLLDGTMKLFIKPTSNLVMLKSRDKSEKAVSSGCSVDDKTSKISSLPHSETCSPSLRLATDGTTETSVKSTSDFVMPKPLDESGKSVSIGCSDDDSSLQMQKPGSSSSSDRTQLVNDAARAPSTPTSGLHPISSFVSRGVSPSRARVPSPARVRPSSPTRQSHSSTSVLSFMSDIIMGKKTANHIDDVHKLRLLYNRHLQWQYINAQMDTASQSQKVKAENMLYSVWMTIADLWDSIMEKRIDLQQLRLKLNLYSVLNNQLSCLDKWASIERDHVNSVTWTMQDAEANIIHIPVSGGAKCDVKTVKAAVCSAVDVMQAIGSSLSSILSRVEGMNCLLSELADVVSQERALLDECELVLGPASELQVEEYSLRSHLLQMKQV